MGDSLHLYWPDRRMGKSVDRTQRFWRCRTIGLPCRSRREVWPYTWQGTGIYRFGQCGARDQLCPEGENRETHICRQIIRKDTDNPVEGCSGCRGIWGCNI